MANRTGGLESPMGLTFGPDGNLWVAAASYLTRDPKVLRFQGPEGTDPGALIDSFIPSYSDGQRLPFSMQFGPDGNRDGHPNLYVIDAEVNTASLNGKKGSVKRFDGVTGTYIDTFVREGDHGLGHVGYINFTRTDPVTLAYTGGTVMASSSAAEPVNKTLRADRVRPLLTKAIARLQPAGEDIAGLTAIVRGDAGPGSQQHYLARRQRRRLGLVC